MLDFPTPCPQEAHVYVSTVMMLSELD